MTVASKVCVSNPNRERVSYPSCWLRCHNILFTLMGRSMLSSRTFGKLASLIIGPMPPITARAGVGWSQWYCWPVPGAGGGTLLGGALICSLND